MQTIRVRPNVILRVPAVRLPWMGGAASPESQTEVIDNIWSTTWQMMSPTVADNIMVATPFTYWLKSKNRIRRVKGGRYISEALMYGKNPTVASVGPGGQVSITQANIETNARFDWRWYAGSILRLRTDDQINRAEHEIRSLIEDKTTNLELSMIDGLEAIFFGDGSGNNGLDPLGLKAIVRTDPTTNPPSPPGNVGSIDAVANTYWRNQQRTWDTTGLLTGDTDIAFNLRKLYNKCSIGNDHPTLLLTEVSQYERYEATLVGKLQVYEVGEFGDMGFQGLKFKGAVLTFSPSAPVQTLYMLNERYLRLYIDTFSDFALTEWKGIPDQLDRVAQVVVSLQLVTNNRRLLGVLTGMPA